jgi:predicted nucleic acid-binding protein
MKTDNYLLDTNVVIDYLENKLPSTAVAFLDKLNYPKISIVTKIELLIFPDSTIKQQELILEYIGYCNVISFDEDVAVKIIELKRKYKVRDFDSIIAATALVYNFPLVTNDKGFSNIKDLKIINPYTFDFE